VCASYTDAAKRVKGIAGATAGGRNEVVAEVLVDSGPRHNLRRFGPGGREPTAPPLTFAACKLRDDAMGSTPDEVVPPDTGSPGTHDASPLTDSGAAPPTAALEYARRLFENITDWYNAADTKAQVILTIDGAFIAFLSSTLFAEPAKLRALSNAFSAGTWVLLLLMSLALTGSIASALACLWSRLYGNREIDDIFRQLGVDVHDAASYKPGVLWFFQFLRRLEGEHVETRLLQMDETGEVRALRFQITALSDNVMRKHKWVNAGFVLTGSSFVLFLAAGITYIIRL
jgi:hypothetical protein